MVRFSCFASIHFDSVHYHLGQGQEENAMILTLQTVDEQVDTSHG